MGTGFIVNFPSGLSASRILCSDTTANAGTDILVLCDIHFN